MASRPQDTCLASIQSSISRTHIAWAATMLIAFAFFGGMYMQRLEYTRSQVERRDILIQMIARGLTDTTTAAVATALDIPRGRMRFYDAILNGDIPELGYIKDYIEARRTARHGGHASPSTLVSMDSAATSRISFERDELKKLGLQLDTVSVPGTPIRMVTSDLGTLGAIALALASFWLLGNLRNTNEAVIALLGAKKGKSGGWTLAPVEQLMPQSGEAEMFHAVANSAVFFERTARPWLCYAFEATLFLPLLLTLSNSINDFVTMWQQGLYSWHHVRWCFGALLAVGVGVLSACSDAAYRSTRHVMREWHSRLASPATTSEDEQHKLSRAATA